MTFKNLYRVLPKYLSKIIFGTGLGLLAFVGACSKKKTCSNSSGGGTCPPQDACPNCPDIPTGLTCETLNTEAASDSCSASASVSCLASARITSLSKPPGATHFLLEQAVINTAGDVASITSSYQYATGNGSAINTGVQIRIMPGPGSATVNISFTASWVSCL